VAYEGKAIRLAEPDAIAAMATLHGLTPPPPDRCRVLELGCASGWNVISMGFRLPKSTFVGVDLVPGQIETGRFAASELGLRNVDLQARSIADITDADGTFDYIICHGVYSWVPPQVQDAILRVCDRNLATNGVAYVSYNMYPGWHRRGMLRDMLLFHDDPSLNPEERVARARAFARALSAVDPSNDTPHVAILREQAAQLEKQTDRHLFHEQLEPWNEPVYFAEFMRRAGAHSLAYVAEASPAYEGPASADFRDGLGPGVDRVRMEQYLDFIRGRTFRRSLLCHASQSVAPEPLSQVVAGLCVRSLVAPSTPAPEDAARGRDVAAFESAEGAKITTNNPLVTAALTVLTRAAPAVVRYTDLRHAVAERLGPSTAEAAATPDVDDASLTGTLLLFAQSGFVEFRVLPSREVVTPSVRPKASALARWQAVYSDEVTTLAHSPHRLMGVERFLLAHLDGTKDRSQLVRVIEHGFAAGDLKLEGFHPTRESLSQVLEDVLGHLGRAALLVA
jgi:SAM-dependent methyltransferase